MSRISVKDAVKRYGNNTVIPDLNLEIGDGELFTLLGPSGCGKTTLLRMIAGFNSIEGGDIFFNEKRINDMDPSKRNIGMVFQNYAIFPNLSVRDNVAFGLKNRKVDKAEIKKRTDEFLNLMQIMQYADRMPNQLSGGQQQRIALARALVISPDVLLMDEPLSNLDAKLRNQMRAEIIKLRQRINTTFVYVTHDQTEAMTLGDRIVIMRDGFIQQIGTPQEVFNHPANLFVAGFIGTPQMNFFDAKLDKDADGYYVELDGARVHLPEEKQQALRANNVEPQDITLGIRPEHIMLCSDDAAAHISATVDVSEMMGSSVHLHVNANGKDVVVIIPTIDLDGSAQQMFGYGSKVNFTFGGNVLHMFSKENEKNLI